MVFPETSEMVRGIAQNSRPWDIHSYVKLVFTFVCRKWQFHFINQENVKSACKFEKKWTENSISYHSLFYNNSAFKHIPLINNKKDRLTEIEWTI